jgi:hypothetical protein
MRISSSCLVMTVMFFAFGGVILAFIVVPALSNFAVIYGPYILATLMGGGFIYVMFSFLRGTASVGADEVLAIFLDVNNKDIHLISGHRTAGMVMRAGPDRTIQHYFITAEGKRYYNELFTHPMTSKMGSGEYTGYASLKESVLENPALQESLRKFSATCHQQVALGERLVRNNDQRYVIDDNRDLQIEQTEKMYRRVMTVVCNDVKGKGWRVGI